MLLLQLFRSQPIALAILFVAVVVLLLILICVYADFLVCQKGISFACRWLMKPCRQNEKMEKKLPKSNRTLRLNLLRRARAEKHDGRGRGDEGHQHGAGRCWLNRRSGS